VIKDEQKCFIGLPPVRTTASLNVSDNVSFYGNGIFGDSTSTSPLTFVSMNTIQIGTYPSPAYYNYMYKASVEFYQKALSASEVMGEYQRFINGSILGDDCED